MKISTKVLSILIAVLLIVTFLPQPALAMGSAQTDPPPLELPQEVVGLALAALTLLSSYLTYYLTEVAKKWAPGLAGTVTQIVAAVIALLTAIVFQVVSFANTWLAGLTDPTMILGIKALFVALVFIISQGIYSSEKKKRTPEVIPKAVAS